MSIEDRWHKREPESSDQPSREHSKGKARTSPAWRRRP
jgi:hypothetical protein